ncbi:MAG: M48 family metalloprotease [Desulfobacteraceae bacterium]|nr:M48 family metalloprotease [Desulfobacteraceae bacterium]
MKPLKSKIPATIVAAVLVLFLSCSQAMALSVKKEKEMAEEFMAMIRKQMTLIDDPMALSLVRDIGKRIVAQLPPQPFEYTFHIVDSDQFNAFASPGANIFVNRGLITSLDNSDELAGILGHESGHAACRHISQMIDKAKLVNIGTLAGVLAGVLVGATGGGDSAQAVVIGSMATGQTAMLAYSRENETEADQKGLSYIKKAGFSPEGLLTGLEKIRANDWYGTESIPGYLKTHPGSKERIIYIQSWLQDNVKEPVTGNGIDPFRFQMVKYRLAGLYGHKDTTETMLVNKLKKHPDNAAIHYGLALLLVRQSRLDQALSHLKQALVLKVFNPWLLMEMGRVYLLKGEPEKALEVFQGLEPAGNLKMPLLFYRGSARHDLGMLAKAREDFMGVVEVDEKTFPRAYYNLASIAGQEGKQGLSHYYLGLYYHGITDGKNALFHLEKALPDLSDSDRIEKAGKIISKLKKQKRTVLFNSRRSSLVKP